MASSRPSAERGGPHANGHTLSVSLGGLYGRRWSGNGGTRSQRQRKKGRWGRQNLRPSTACIRGEPGPGRAAGEVPDARKGLFAAPRGRRGDPFAGCRDRPDETARRRSPIGGDRRRRAAGEG